MSANPEPAARFVADHVTGLVLALAVLTGGAGYVLGDDVGGQDPAAALNAFFSASAQVMAGLLIALALFQSGPTAAAGHEARRFLSRAVFPMLGLGVVAALVGVVNGLSDWDYRAAFAIVVGAGAASLTTTLMVGAANIRAQRRQAIQEVAVELDPDPVSGRAPSSGRGSE
jgi:hypothetical protein